MSNSKSRPRALIAIITYKCFTIGLLIFVAIGLFMTSKKYDALFTFAEEYMTTGKREIIKGGLAQMLSISTTKMQFGAVVAGIYAAVNALEAFGLWHQKAWATVMVAGIVGLTIPIEIFEIYHHVSLVKIGVFVINVAMFIYLFRHALEERSKRVGGRM
jgi:uncharacterized membrane protein (DUF2068 family)